MKDQHRRSNRDPREHTSPQEIGSYFAGSSSDTHDGRTAHVALRLNPDHSSDWRWDARWLTKGAVTEEKWH
jgi:hypothetical protein